MGGEQFFIQKGENEGRKMKIGSEKRSMASLMPICAGLVGPKSENVDFPQVFACFIEVQGRGE